MRLTLLHELARFLSALEQAQEALLSLFAAKRIALDTLQSQELIRLASVEQQLAVELQEVVHQRTKLLDEARGAGFAVESLLELAGAIGRTVGDSRVLAAIELLTGRIIRSQQRTARMQHESWVHWIISHRCYNHYTELLDLIAHGGHPAPTYGGTPSASAGGALLDAAA
ncbi:MAG TPA: hypothetical protein VKU82_11040 [Planctomycetaceae bacterium]|nr:hypothetical protein [Planctomycetaceae bacterium]